MEMVLDSGATGKGEGMDWEEEKRDHLRRK